MQHSCDNCGEVLRRSAKTAQRSCGEDIKNICNKTKDYGESKKKQMPGSGVRIQWMHRAGALFS